MVDPDLLEVECESLDYTDGSRTFEGYLARPVGLKAAAPCILLAHDWSGLNAAMKQLAKRIASLGVVCFAIDVYGKGVRGDQVGDNSHLMNPFMEDRFLLSQRLLAGLDAAIHLPGVDPESLAVFGYCFGGLCALDLARTGRPEIKLVVSFHGGLQAPRDTPQQPISASVLLLHGWDDPIVPVSDVLAATEELTAAGADWQLVAYGHAMHAFTFEGARLPERGIAYNEVADRRSWAAMQAFLEERFGDRIKKAWLP